MMMPQTLAVCFIVFAVCAVQIIGKAV